MLYMKKKVIEAPEALSSSVVLQLPVEISEKLSVLSFLKNVAVRSLVRDMIKSSVDKAVKSLDQEDRQIFDMMLKRRLKNSASDNSDNIL